MAAGDVITGKALAITVGGTAVPNPQSFAWNKSLNFIRWRQVGSSGLQKEYDSTDVTATVTLIPANDDDIADIISESTTAAVVVYPDGNVATQAKYTFNAYVYDSGNYQGGAAGTVTLSMEVDGTITEGDATGS